jgi:hypothetical protein
VPTPATGSQSTEVGLEPSSRIPAWMGVFAAIERQRFALLTVAVLVYVPVTLLVLALAVIAEWKQIPFSVVTSDPAATGRLPFYAGILSSTGMIFWCSAAAISLFAVALVRMLKGPSRDWHFLLASGVFVAVLLSDDLFLVHEVVFPEYLGIPQKWLLTAYAAGAVAYLVGFAPLIIRTDFLILLSALAALGASMTMDQLPFQVPRHLVWEDGAKVLGAAGWCAYLARTGAQAVRRAAARSAFAGQ